ncbi:MAG: InlB B-repeat-containing protein [Clostridia bacterium]|nr:InlB B-repeat-containing protein [Clostridia bacterium]
MSGYNLAMGQENNSALTNMGINSNPYELTVEDFKNIVIVPVNDDLANDYGAMFPIFIEHEEATMEDNHHTIQGYRTTDSNKPIHISANGNDETGDGSIEKPVKTYAKAREIMGQKLIFSQSSTQTVYFYRNSVAVIGSVTPEMGIPDEMLPMLWYTFNKQNCYDYREIGNYSREGKNIQLMLEDTTIPENTVNWLVLEGEIIPTISETDFVFTMPATSVSLVADIGQVLYTTDIQLNLDIPDPDNVEETSFATIESVTVANYKGENQATLSEQEIIDTFGSKTVDITWKKVAAGNFGLTQDEPFAVFTLDTSYVKNNGQGYAMPKDVAISVNGYEAAVRVDSYEHCSVAHLVRRQNIPELPTPQVLLASSGDVQVTNQGVTDVISVTASGVYEYTKPVKWNISEVSDANDILQIVTTEGYLPTGNDATAQLSKIIISPNKIGHGKKTARVKITFEKEDGIINYKGMPDSITVDYTLAPGDPMPMVEANINFTDEVVEVTKGAQLEDYVVEYMILEEGEYTKAKWDGSAVRVLNSSTIDLDGYIANFSHTPNVLYIRYRQIAADPGPGEMNEVVIPDRPSTPAMTVNYHTEKTNEVATYPLVYGTSADNLTQTANDETVALTPGTNLYFQVAATPISFASLVQELVVKPRPAAPADIGINYYEEVTNKAIGEDIQYGKTEEILLARETIGEGKAVTLTPGVNMYFAYKSTEEDFRSEIFTLEVPARPAAPAFTVDYKEEKTNETIPSTVMYGIHEGAMDTVGIGNKLILSPGTDVYFYKPATSTEFKSDPQHLVVKTRRSAPDAKGVDETIWNIGDGKIKGLDAPNEYRVLKANGQWDNWINNDDDKTIKNLTTGTYEVRYTATSEDFISHSTTVEIGYGRTITVKFDSNKGTKIESQTGLKYGDKINEPANPEKQNCEFVKWCEDSLLLNGWNFDKDTVKDDMTLHAKWKRNKMDTPERLKWNEEKANWGSVDDEDSYSVRLYKDGVHVETLTTNKSSLDMSDYLYKHGSGDYKYTVIATSSDKDIKDSDVASSETMTYYKPPVITLQPVDCETTEGGELRFEVGAEVDRNEKLSYTWIRQEVGHLTTETCIDQFGPVYYVGRTGLKECQYYFTCRVEDEQGNSVFSNWALLTVNKKPEVSIDVSSYTIYNGDTVTLTANGKYGTGTLSYEWSDEKYSTDKSITLKLQQTTKLMVVVTDERGISGSSTVTITVQKSPAELVYEQFTSLESLLKSVSADDMTSGHVYYLMKSAVDGYQALTAADLKKFDSLVPGNGLKELYNKYADLIKQSDSFTEKVLAVTLDYKPAAKSEIDILEKEMAELIEKDIPISTSVTDEQTGLMTLLKSKVADTREVEKEILTLVREILGQMSNDELSAYKEQMKAYMGEIPEPEAIPGFFTYLKQLFTGKAEIGFFTYIQRAFESKSSAELRAFVDSLIEFLKNHENKEEMITYTCETLSKAYEAKNNNDVRNAIWAYNVLDADEKNMVAPAIKSLINALYNQLIEQVSADELQAIVFEEKVETAEAAPSLEGIVELETTYTALTDDQKEYVNKEIVKKYDALVADKNEAQKIADTLNGIDGETLRYMLTSTDQGTTNVVEKFNSLTDRQKTLIKEALGRKADDVIRCVRIIQTAKSLDRVKMTDEEYAANVLEIIKDSATLSEKAFTVLTSAFNDTQLFKDIAAWVREHNFTCSASTNNTDITVSGLTKDTIEDIVQANNIEAIDLQVNDNTTYPSDSGVGGKKNVFSVDTRLMITMPQNDGGYEIKDVKLKKNVQVKMRIPNNYQLESLELWNVTADNQVNLVETEFIWNGTDLYAVFLTQTFGQFILYANDIATTADILVGDTIMNANIGEISVDTYYNQAQTATIKIINKGLNATKVQYCLTPSIYNLDGVKTIANWIDYTGEFSLKTNAQNVIYVRITDELGNVTYAASTGMVVDTIAPSITGVTNRNYCTSPTMTVSDTNLKIATMDGKGISLSNGQYSIPVGTHEIVVIDKAGNSAKVNATVFDGHKPSAWQDIDEDTHRKYCEGCGAQVNKEDHKFNQEVVDSKHLKEAATYNKEGTYYKSCVCGRTDNTLVKSTFKGGGLKYDGVAPTVSISVKNETNKKIKYHVEMTDGESGMYRRYHYDAGAPMDLNSILKITGWERLTLGIETFTIKKADTKAVYIKAVDEQGNYTITDSSGKVLYQYVHPK